MALQAYKLERILGLSNRSRVEARASGGRPVEIGHEPFDARLLADLRAGVDPDELVARVVEHYRMTTRQARHFLSFMTSSRKCGTKGQS